MKYSLSTNCGQCHRDFVAGEVVNYTPLENRSFCDSCRNVIYTNEWERRVIPTEEERQEESAIVWPNKTSN